MREIAHALCAEYGGQMLYMPRDTDFALIRRDLDIAAEHNGTNTAELAKKYQITSRQVYTILAYVRRLRTGRGGDAPAGAVAA